MAAISRIPGELGWRAKAPGDAARPAAGPGGDPGRAAADGAGPPRRSTRLPRARPLDLAARLRPGAAGLPALRRGAGAEGAGGAAPRRGEKHMSFHFSGALVRTFAIQGGRSLFLWKTEFLDTHGEERKSCAGQAHDDPSSQREDAAAKVIDFIRSVRGLSAFSASDLDSLLYDWRFDLLPPLGNDEASAKGLHLPRFSDMPSQKELHELLLGGAVPGMHQCIAHALYPDAVPWPQEGAAEQAAPVDPCEEPQGHEGIRKEGAAEPAVPVDPCEEPQGQKGICEEPAGAGSRGRRTGSALRGPVPQNRFHKPSSTGRAVRGSTAGVSMPADDNDGVYATMGSTEQQPPTPAAAAGQPAGSGGPAVEQGDQFRAQLRDLVREVVRDTIGNAAGSTDTRPCRQQEEKDPWEDTDPWKRDKGVMSGLRVAVIVGLMATVQAGPKRATTGKAAQATEEFLARRNAESDVSSESFDQAAAGLDEADAAMPQAMPGTSGGQQLEPPPLADSAGPSTAAAPVLLAGPFQGMHNPGGNVFQYDHAAFGAGQAETRRVIAAGIEESINGLVGAVNNVETALQQIGYMVVNIGTVMNTGQANPAWQMGDPWYESPAGAAGTGSSGSEQPVQSVLSDMSNISSSGPGT
ncbi:unnamed protein product [Prorocentrum cordatum]|uniref:Autophagy-related protein 101 n=1 Tax=Prorocentrum cordatum TaxID=2364126 RepID=A0ABN9Y278_9DINO|nr:unnamed protein product [Polarella glacialis]